MRIIAGAFAKRKLFTLKSRKTRPTSDKVKESLFNSLGQFFHGGQVLDLYAGSGALGIEAVSRGFDHAVLNDINYAAVKIIKKNVALTKKADRFTVYKMPSQVALAHLAAHKQTFDLVFLDPPYARQKIRRDLQKLLADNLLNHQALVVAETDDETEIRPPAGLSLLKKHHLGKTIIRIYRKDL